MNPNDKPEYRFYIAKGAVNVQKGLYILLHEKKGIPVDTIIECIDKYDLLYGTEGGKKQYRSKKDMLELLGAYTNMDKLLQIVTDVTGISFKVNDRKRKKRTNYIDNTEQYWK